MSKYYSRLYPDPDQTTPSGGFVEAHVLHGKSELQKNLETASILAEYGYKVRLLPVGDTPNKKNPNAFFIDEGIEVEFKYNLTPTISAVDNEIKYAKKQANHMVLHIMSNIEKGDLLKAIKSRVRRSENIQHLWLIFGGHLYSFSREDIITDLIDHKIQ